MNNLKADTLVERERRHLQRWNNGSDCKQRKKLSTKRDEKNNLETETLMEERREMRRRDNTIDKKHENIKGS